MSESSQLIAALKQCLKARRITYAALAKELHLSEASVKRVFARGTFSLDRLQSVCRVLDMSFYDLARLSSPGDARVSTLTLEQENALASDANLLTTFYLILNDWTPAEVRRQYAFDERQQRRLLAQLEELGLIELLPRMQCRLRVGRRIVWRRDGPVRRAYERQVKAEFLQSKFDAGNELLRFQPAELTERSASLLHRKLEQLYREFLELAELDLLASEPRRSVGLLLAFRPWVFSLVAARRRERAGRAY